MKPICLTIVCTTMLLVSSMPSLIPSGADRFALALIGTIAFAALLLTRDRRL